MGDEDDCFPPAAQCPDDGISKERLSNMGVDYTGISANLNHYDRQILLTS